MKIKTKILCTLLGMSLLVALVGAFAVNRQRAIAMVGVTKEAEDVARVVSLLFTSGSNQLSATSTQAIVAELHRVQKRDVVVMDASQLVLADAVPSEIGKNFTQDPLDEVGATIKDRQVRTFIEVSPEYPAGIKQIVVPMEGRSGQVLGAVILEYTPLYNELMRSTRNTILQVILAAAGSFALALLIAFYMGRSIAGPLQQLTNVAAGFASGRTDLPMPPPGEDEIGELAAAFNNMVEKRQRTEGELRRLRDELEARVAGRTAELARANGALQMENDERRRAEDALQRSQKRLRDIIDGVGPTMFVGLMTREGILIECNRPALTAAGLKPEDVLGKPFVETHWWAHSPELQRQVREAIARGGRGEASRFDVRTRAAGNQVMDVDFSLHPLRNESGEVVFLVPSASVITERKLSEAALEKAHHELVAASRLAGMAEVATGVLHNVGNVLNSVNVASSCLADSLKRSKAANLSKVVALLREHEKDLGDFLTHDPKGSQVQAYLGQLAGHLAGEQADALKELAELQKNIEHIKDIVSMQQRFAGTSAVTETVNVADLVEDALRMNSSALARHDIEVIKEFKDMPPVTLEKHKALQILVNLVRNAKQACEGLPVHDRKLTIRTTKEADRVRITVGDNGVGIPPENLARIFSHGFTTKPDGHGFGLHSAALAAKEMGGSLTVQSGGPGQGAAFTLELRCSTPENQVG